MENLVKEFNERTEKAKKMRSEFDKLPYSEKLKIMDDNFGSFNSIGDPPIISVIPVKEEEIELFNNWKSKLFDSEFNPYMAPDDCIDYSFERLKKRFDDYIWVKKREYPNLPELINDYTLNQISLYEEKIKGRDILQQFKEFGDDWDMSKKVIVNLGPFLKAKACYKYLNYLKGQSDKITDIREPFLGKEYLLVIYDQYKEYFKGEDKESWVERFIYPNGRPVNEIEIDKEARLGSNKLVLLAILASVQKTTGNAFSYDPFVRSRFGLMGYQRAKSLHQNKETYKTTYNNCVKLLKNVIV